MADGDKSKHLLPNSFQCPNVIIDKLWALLTDLEAKVLMPAVRNILGWHECIGDRRANISLTRLEDLTGKSRPSVVKAMNSLESFGIVGKVGEATRKGQEWELTMLTRPDEVAWDRLEARRDEGVKRGRKRTKGARAAADEKRRQDAPTGMSDKPVEGDNTGMSDKPVNPPSGMSDKPITGMSDIHNKPILINPKDSANATASAPPSNGHATDLTAVEEKSKRKPKASAVVWPDGWDETQADAWYDALAAGYHVYGGRNTKLVKMMLGISTDKGYREYNFDPPATLEEVQHFPSWYRRKYPDTDVPLSPEKLQSHFYAFRAEAAQQHTRQLTADTVPRYVDGMSRAEALRIIEERLHANGANE